MLGLRPRLRARNSLWDLVNKHPHHLQDSHSSFSSSWKQTVEEGTEGLPSLSFPSVSSPTSPEQQPPHNHSSESSASFTMARVCFTASITSCGIADQENYSQRKIRRDLGRRLAKSNMVGLQSSSTLEIEAVHKADCRLAQDPSSPFRGMSPTRLNKQGMA